MTRMIGTAMLAMGLAVFGGVPAAGLAQTPGEQVQHRQDQMSILGDNIRVIARFVQRGTGSIDEVAASARAMAAVTGDLLALFPPGTAVGVGDSEALPAIWENWAEFEPIARDAHQATTALLAAAEAGDTEALRPRFAAVGQTCSSCHQTFRQD